MKRLWKWLVHTVAGCDMKLLGWTHMGNPVQHCLYCDRYFVTYGSVNPTPLIISEKQAMEAIETYEGQDETAQST